MRPLLSILGWMAIGAWLSLPSGCSKSSQAETQAASSANEPSAAAVEHVAAGLPQRQTLRAFTSQPGRIEAFQRTPLFPKVTGYVHEILVDIGDRVKKDQVLVRLWVPEMQDELAQKKALLAQSEAQVSQAEAAIQAAAAGLATARARVAQAEAGVVRADAEYQRWKAEYDRLSHLADRGSVTRKLVDETLNQFRASDAARQEAAAHVESVKAAVVEAAANVEKAKADAVAARAQQKVAAANLAYAQTMLAYTEIKAPFDGVVTERSVDTGHYVHPANGGDSAPLLVVAHTDRVRIFVDVPEMEAALVDPGDPATVRVQALRGAEVEGSVTRTSWTLNPANRSLRTEIDLPNEAGRLRPGMYATAEILLETKENALTVPATAVVHKGLETAVCRVQSGKIVQTPVKLGLQSNGRVEVLDGLQEGELVVLTRVEGLTDGQLVEVMDPENP